MERKTLKQLIQEADLTYRELAERMGVKHTQVVALCRPGANPTLKTLIKLSRELNVTLEDLALAFGEDVSAIPDDPIGHDPNEN